ncbi:TPA: hypothetical protein DCZ46_04330 [Candidatus Campbellbacteria bacterium]|nr:MAG: Peptidase C60A/B, sortase-like protein [Candidatus Campbellbacteria bacterium GW2011_OD1_34_28]KKP75064.1 MAG: hypothetical protein UR74_C0002G0330 [Candidatus Campbellbacteria bacterium GW2011_GWD2_35_24]KKP75950.1 MAG: sortase family protein [Candidatus Campbellbacteria bacterium GW2011_GWC2_35_28]KKP76802.1 MAG: hypothetical protein UR76_C0002G0003 [Candidatus Campbellbacteria bacterium GW2011_GWC1_35_31]KKP78728.1 MAG: hypothetical protein UR79_C0002G0003 [Candidatus Campbellbacteri
MMNPLNKRINDNDSGAPDNLPYEGELRRRDDNYDVSFKVPKKGFKTALKVLIVLIILVVAAPRIVNNVKNTTEVAGEGAEKFPTYFPSLSKVGTFFGSVISSSANFISENLSAVAELFYSKRIPEGGIVDVTEEVANPIRIVIDKINVDSAVLNPTSSDLSALDEALKYGVVRYPKSGLLGQEDNIYLFGHSTSYQVVRNQAYKALNNLEKLEVGDTIKVRSENKEHLYKVTSVRTERDSDAVVKFNTGKRTLTISTCNTLGAKEDRHIVEADFVTSYPISGIVDNSDSDTISGNTTNTNNTNSNTNTGNTTTILNPGQTTTQIIPISGGSTIGVSNPYGQADLTAEIIEVGIIDPNTNKFVASSTPNTSSKVAFRFIISNIGTKTADGWTFNIVLPTDPIYIYHSNTQGMIRPGERIEYMLGFDRAKAGTDMAIIVNVNPAGSINEKTRDNNIIKKFITIIKNG